MKNYLDLIPISAKVHRRQTRMTRWCIMLSVFLIAAIFGMADMFLLSQKNLAAMTDGTWHVMFRELDEEQMAILAARPEVKTAARYAATNYRLDMGYEIDGIQTVLCGFDEAFLEIQPGIHLTAGTFPRADREVLVLESVGRRLGLALGDSLEVTTPKGALTFTISGFLEDTAMMLKSDAFGVFMNTETYLSCFQDVTLQEDFVYYVEFVPHLRIQKAVREICAQLQISEDLVSENAKLMGTLLQSSDRYIWMLYLVALILAVLVAVSGMMMILSSMNSNVAQRTEFFGMMRCLGATPKQVRRYVRREAFYWCRRAISLGLLASVASNHTHLVWRNARFWNQLARYDCRACDWPYDGAYGKQDTGPESIGGFSADCGFRKCGYGVRGEAGGPYQTDACGDGAGAASCGGQQEEPAFAHLFFCLWYYFVLGIQYRG